MTSCRGDDQLHDVLALMKEKGFVHIPIVDKNSHPCGVVNAETRCKRSYAKSKTRNCLSAPM